jgi:dynein regulatory complex protein 1
VYSKLVGCRLESDIAVLEQHLETMRATYQLNAEKLEYNYRVLLERDAGERCGAHRICWSWHLV